MRAVSFEDLMSAQEKGAFAWLHLAWTMGVDETAIIRSLRTTYSLTPIRVREMLHNYKEGRK